MKTHLNAKALKNHLTYNWWKYLLAVLAGTFLVDLLFTVTAPKIPEEKRVDFYVYGYTNEEALMVYMDKVHEEEMADMESVKCVTLTMDSTYGPMQLTTYISVGEGDLYLLPRDEFLSLSSSGAFCALEEDEEMMAMFDAAGKNLRRGWRTVDDLNETHLFGIPLDLHPGLSQYCYAEDGYLAVLLRGGNTENTMKFLRILVRDMIDPVETSDSAQADN